MQQGLRRVQERELIIKMLLVLVVVVGFHL